MSDRAEHLAIIGTFFGLKHCCIKAIIPGNKPCSRHKDKPVFVTKSRPAYYKGQPLNLSARQRAKIRAVLKNEVS